MPRYTSRLATRRLIALALIALFIAAAAAYYAK